MKRIIWLISFVLFVLLGYLVVRIRPYFTPAIKQVGLNITKHSDDTIRIAYLGDSWADGHKKVNCLIDSFVRSAINRPVVVRVAGISGLTSKNIYYSIFKNDSFRDVIEWGPDFCFVVAGINDSDRKMGKWYYKENMRLILEFLIENDIVPIVLEIPSYDINFSFKRRNRQTKMKYLISMLVTWSKMDCIEEYRDAYIDLIKENNWGKCVVNISNDMWNPDGYMDSRCLYDEGRMHLNEKGYHILDSCISSKIINWIMNESGKESH